jgi:hypothetical protein
MSTVENVVNYTLDDMNYFWMSNGAPCFVANNWEVVDDICEVIESFGFQIYYLICDKATYKNVQTKDSKGVVTQSTSVSYAPSILKVVNNFVGRSVSDSSDPLGSNFASVEEVAQYTMPYIPRTIVDKLDEFFRLVDAQHHTESIVILTYDPTKEGPDGWGVLVPEQQNTSVHCKYDADSIVAIKPDEAMIVGSVHSHPDMPAYASGTDHEDQADFDGIHITYGWQKTVNNGATQYHIELQMGGTAFTLKPEDVFEPLFVSKSPDPEVVEWTQKVKKVQPLNMGGSATQATQATLTQTQSYQKMWAQQPPNSQPTTAGTETTTHKSFDKSIFLKELDSIPHDSIVAIEIDLESVMSADCLICSFPLELQAIKSGFCPTCDTPIITQDMGQYDIITMIHHYCSSRALDPNVGYYIYCVDEHNPVSNFLLNIKPQGLDPFAAGSDVVPDDDFVYEEKTLCCGVNLTDVHLCSCKKTVTESNIKEFDEAHKKRFVYQIETDCFNCVNYYDVSCPSFKQSIVEFVQEGFTINDPIDVCASFVHYKNSKSEFDYIAEREYYYD